MFQKTARFTTSPVQSESAFSNKPTGGILKNSNKRSPLAAFAEEKTEIIFPETYETQKTAYDQNISFSKGKVPNRFNMFDDNLPVSSPPEFSTSYNFSSSDDKKIFNPSPELKIFHDVAQFTPLHETRTLLDIVDDYLKGDYDNGMYSANAEDVQAFLSQIEFPETELPTFLSPLSLTTDSTSTRFSGLIHYIKSEVAQLDQSHSQLFANIQENIPNAIAATKGMPSDSVKNILSYANKLVMQYHNEALFEILKKIKEIEEDHQNTLVFINQLKTALDACEEIIKTDKYIQANMKYKEIQNSMKEYKEQHGDIDVKKELYCALHKLNCYKVTSLKKNVATVLTPYFNRPITVQHNPRSVGTLYSSLASSKRLQNLKKEIMELSVSLPCVVEKDINPKVKIVSVVFSNLEKGIRFSVDFTIFTSQYPYQKLITQVKCLTAEDKNISQNVKAICDIVPIGNKPLTDAIMKIRSTYIL